MSTWFPRYWKAVMGFLTPAAVVISSSTLESSAGGSTITSTEWITAGCAAVITAGAVAIKGNANG